MHAHNVNRIMLTKSCLIQITRQWPRKHWNSALSNTIQCSLLIMISLFFAKAGIVAFLKSRDKYQQLIEFWITKKILHVVEILILRQFIHHFLTIPNCHVHCVPSHFNPSYLFSIVTNKQNFNCIVTFPCEIIFIVQCGCKAKGNKVVPSIKPAQLTRPCVFLIIALMFSFFFIWPLNNLIQ